MASRWQHCVRFDQPEIGFKTPKTQAILEMIIYLEQIFCYTCCNTPKRVRIGGAQFRVIAPGQHSSRNSRAFRGTEGMQIKSRAGEIRYSVANGSPPLRHFIKRSCVARFNDTELGPANSLHAFAYYSKWIPHTSSKTQALKIQGPKRHES